MSRFVEPMLLALALVLMGCAPMPPQPSPPYTGQCDASKATWAIGKAATADVVERIRVETGSQVARVLKPGQVVTMEYSAARVNINVNERNAITGVTCGGGRAPFPRRAATTCWRDQMRSSMPTTPECLAQCAQQ